MSRHLPKHPSPKLPALLLGLLAFAAAHPVHAEEPENNSEPKLMIVCLTSLSEDQEVVLASRDENGKWLEHSSLKLRSSLISGFLPADRGELHLALRGARGLESICEFTYPEGAGRALAALVADPENKSYTAHLADPQKLGFGKGSVLIFNLSPDNALVSLGSSENKVEAGQQRVAKAVAEGNGMYRLMISHTDGEGQDVISYDRQTSAAPNSREMLFLLPDETLGIRVLSLPLFGSID
jgi:hypothetical protein